MIRLLLALALVTGTLWATAGAYGAERPGTLEGRIASFPETRIEALAVTSDGRIVMAGATGRNPRTWIRAYLSDGTPDHAFGDEGTLDFGAEWPELIAMVAHPDGRMIIAQRQASHAARISRLNRDGSLDGSFGTGGSVDTRFGPPQGNSLTDLLLQPDGGIVLVGAQEGDSSPGGILQIDRYRSDGSPDTTFGTGGRTEVSASSLDNRGAKAAVQPNGAIVLELAGGFAQPPMLARLSADGRLDDNFGRGGLAPIELANPRFADDVEASSAGPLVLPGGRIRLPALFERRIGPNYRMALVGLTSNGHPDRRFGVRGLAVAPVPLLATSEEIHAAVRDPSGSIIMAGTTRTPEHYSIDVPIIRRFRPNGSSDRSFGSNGVFHDPKADPEYEITVQTLAVLDEDTLIVGDHTVDPRGFGLGSATLTMLNAGHDRARPSISLSASGCRSATVRIRDLSAMYRVVVRVGHRVAQRTTRKRFRIHVRRGGQRIAVRATDLAGNSSSRRLRLPHC